MTSSITTGVVNNVQNTDTTGRSGRNPLRALGNAIRSCLRGPVLAALAVPQLLLLTAATVAASLPFTDVKII